MRWCRGVLVFMIPAASLLRCFLHVLLDPTSLLPSASSQDHMTGARCDTGRFSDAFDSRNARLTFLAFSLAYIKFLMIDTLCGVHSGSLRKMLASRLSL